jgi:hypothetical protein
MVLANLLAWLVLVQTPQAFEISTAPVKIDTPEIVSLRKAAGDQRGDLTKLMLKWQTRLGLNHFALSLRVVAIEKLPPHELGTLFLDYTTGIGTISVLDAGDYLKTDPGVVKYRTLHSILRDQEDTVVHELVHISLQNPYEITDAHWSLYNEYLTVKLTESLLRRGK